MGKHAKITAVQPKGSPFFQSFKSVDPSFPGKHLIQFLDSMMLVLDSNCILIFGAEQVYLRFKPPIWRLTLQQTPNP